MLCEAMEILTQLDRMTTPFPDFLEAGRKKIFNFSYEMFDMSHKTDFENLFIRYYYHREIGLETIGLFLMQLETEIKLKLPVYNALYKVESLDFDPLATHTLHREITEDGTSEGSSNTNGNSYSDTQGNQTGTSKNTRLFSDTPQNGTSSIENLSTITNATVDTTMPNLVDASHTTTTTRADAKTSNKDSKKTIFKEDGRDGLLYGDVLENYIENVKSIDMLFIKDLEDLFMLIY